MKNRDKLSIVIALAATLVVGGVLQAAKAKARFDVDNPSLSGARSLAALILGQRYCGYQLTKSEKTSMERQLSGMGGGSSIQLYMQLNDLVIEGIRYNFEQAPVAQCKYTLTFRKSL